MNVTIKLQNWDALKNQLNTLPDKLMVKAVRPATREATKYVAEDMKRRAPVRTGWIRKSITVMSDARGKYGKWKRFNPRDWASYIAGPLKEVVPAGLMSKSGKMVTRKLRPWWAIFVEKGTKSTFTIEAVRRKVLATRGIRKGRRIVGGAHLLTGNYRAYYLRRHGEISGDWIFFGRKVRGRGQPPRPFVRPALDENVNRVIDQMKTALAAGVHTIQRGL